MGTRTITNKQISARLNALQLKFDRIENIQQAVRQIAKGQAERERWGNLTGKQQSDYFAACGRAIQLLKNVDKYFDLYEIDAFPEIAADLSSKELLALRTASSLKSQADRAVVKIKDALPPLEGLPAEEDIRKRAEVFLDWRKNCKETQNWSE